MPSKKNKNISGSPKGLSSGSKGVNTHPSGGSRNSFKYSKDDKKEEEEENVLDINEVFKKKAGNKKVNNFKKKYSKKLEATEKNKKRVLVFAGNSLNYGEKELTELASKIDFVGQVKGMNFVGGEAGEISSIRSGGMFSNFVGKLTGKSATKESQFAERAKMVNRLASLFDDDEVDDVSVKVVSPNDIKNEQQNVGRKVFGKQDSRAKTNFASNSNFVSGLKAGQQSTIALLSEAKENLGIISDTSDKIKQLFKGQPVTERLYSVIQQGKLTKQEEKASLERALGRAAASVWQKPEEVAEEANELGVDPKLEPAAFLEKYAELKGEKEYDAMLNTFNKNDDGVGTRLSDNEKVSIVAYTSQFYKHMNGLLKNVSNNEPSLVNEASPSKEAIQNSVNLVNEDIEKKDIAVTAQLAMEAMSKMPQFAGAVQRITVLPKGSSENYKQGSEFFYSGFTSSSDSNHSDLFEEYDPRSFSSNTEDKEMYHMLFNVKNGVKIGKYGVNAGEGGGV